MPNCRYQFLTDALRNRDVVKLHQFSSFFFHWCRPVKERLRLIVPERYLNGHRNKKRENALKLSGRYFVDIKSAFTRKIYFFSASLFRITRMKTKSTSNFSRIVTRMFSINYTRIASIAIPMNEGKSASSSQGGVNNVGRKRSVE